MPEWAFPGSAINSNRHNFTQLSYLPSICSFTIRRFRGTNRTFKPDSVIGLSFRAGSLAGLIVGLARLGVWVH
jgi:1-aminocyclopropane-1-carboxylate deaminase/D-cysteine desulfhydrase-like pyridoxal-dependent ACC family enzyme